MDLPVSDITFFQAIADQSDDAIILTSRDKVLYVNPAFERIFGLKKESVLNASKILESALITSERAIFQKARKNYLKKKCSSLKPIPPLYISW